VVERVEEVNKPKADERKPPPSAHRARRRRRHHQCRRRAAEDPVEEDDDDFENSLSLAAMEAELAAGDGDASTSSPTPTRSCASCRTSRSRPARRAGDAVAQPGPPPEGAEGPKLITDVKSLSLNTSRIESLVEQLYDINKRLVQNEGKLLRLAESYGVKREEFLASLLGLRARPELARSGRGADHARAGRSSPSARADTSATCAPRSRTLATETGLDRRVPPIVNQVQKGEREAAIAKKEMVEANLRLVISIAKNTPTAACSSLT
jgi:RNA polymerase primary sigma factor